MFQDIPNIGPAMERDFLLLGITTPEELRDKDPFDLYQQLCVVTGTRHDPCVLDVFMAAVDFMSGAPAHPWWRYTEQRKATYSEL